MMPHTAPLLPELEDLGRQILAIKRQTAELLAGLTEAELLERPASGGWSVVECLDHLNLTAKESLALVDPALAEAEVKGLIGSGPFHPRFYIHWFIRSMEPPVRMRSKTGRPFVPPPGLAPEAVTAEFMALQDRLLEQLARASGFDLNRIKVRSPFVKWVSYTLYEWFAVLLAHERRHLWQAEQVIAKLQ